MEDKYSRTVELKDIEDGAPGPIVQLTEYVEGKVLLTITYVGVGDVLMKKELLLTEDEAFAANALMNDWTAQRQH